MAHSDVKTLKAKLSGIKMHAEAIHHVHTTFIDTMAEEIEENKHKEPAHVADINDRLDAACSVLVKHSEESSRLMSELSAPCDDKQGESIAATPLPVARTTPAPQHPGEHDLKKLICRLEELEMKMSGLDERVQENTSRLQSAQEQQDSAFQTVGVTLSSLVSCELDSLDAKLQQMVLNCSEKLNLQDWEIRWFKDEVRNMQTEISGAHLWKNMISELTSRLYTLEATTNRFITEHDNKNKLGEPSKDGKTVVSDMIFDKGTGSDRVNDANSNKVSVTRNDKVSDISNDKVSDKVSGISSDTVSDTVSGTSNDKVSDEDLRRSSKDRGTRKRKVRRVTRNVKDRGTSNDK
ncbi:hypothetical protein BsWGS_12534 [Bradybaena similaris]